jgi:ABC-2 type transport system ATP-binding protein
MNEVEGFLSIPSGGKRDYRHIQTRRFSRKRLGSPGYSGFPPSRSKPEEEISMNQEFAPRIDDGGYAEPSSAYETHGAGGGAQTAICVEDYHKTYQETVAVEGLSFQVEAGQVLGLVGPNGAGKTTTLKAIAGIIPPTKGRLSVAGFDVATQPVQAKQRLAYIPDDPKLFESLTPREHLEFIAATYRVEDYAEKAAALLETFELTEKKDSQAQELSRGMRQKVAICCAFLHDPAAILFDEPLTGLDPRAIRTLKNSIVERAGMGAAVIISSHLLALVEDMCSHLLILERGRKRFWGTMADVRKMFNNVAGDATLEEIFFRATEGDAAAADAAPLVTEG